MLKHLSSVIPYRPEASAKAITSIPSKLVLQPLLLKINAAIDDINENHAELQNFVSTDPQLSALKVKDVKYAFGQEKERAATMKHMKELQSIPHEVLHDAVSTQPELKVYFMETLPSLLNAKSPAPVKVKATNSKPRKPQITVPRRRPSRAKKR